MLDGISGSEFSLTALKQHRMRPHENFSHFDLTGNDGSRCRVRRRRRGANALWLAITRNQQLTSFDSHQLRWHFAQRDRCQLPSTYRIRYPRAFYRRGRYAGDQ